MLTFIWIVSATTLGVFGFSWWWISLFAVGGVVLYYSLKPEMLIHFAQDGTSRLAQVLTLNLAVQAVIPSLFFAIGRLASIAIR